MNAYQAKVMSNKYRDDTLSDDEISCRVNIFRSILCGSKETFCDQYFSKKSLKNLKKDGFEVDIDMIHHVHIVSWQNSKNPLNKGWFPPLRN